MKGIEKRGYEGYLATGAGLAPSLCTEAAVASMTHEHALALPALQRLHADLLALEVALLT